MVITKSLLFTIIVIVQVIGLVAVIWCTHLLPISYLHCAVISYGLFSLVITVGTCIALTEIKE